MVIRAAAPAEMSLDQFRQYEDRCPTAVTHVEGNSLVVPSRLSVEILQRFPTTQRFQPSAVQPHVFLYFIAVNPGVLT